MVKLMSECRARSCATFGWTPLCAKFVMNVWRRAWKSATCPLTSSSISGGLVVLIVVVFFGLPRIFGAKPQQTAGAGPGGRVTENDVKRAIGNPDNPENKIVLDAYRQQSAAEAQANRDTQDEKYRDYVINRKMDPRTAMIMAGVNPAAREDFYTRHPEARPNKGPASQFGENRTAATPVSPQNPAPGSGLSGQGAYQPSTKVPANTGIPPSAAAGAPPPPAASSATVDSAQKARSLLNMAKQYVNAHDLTKAKEFAKQITTQFPDLPEAAEAKDILTIEQ
jgi:hypothetical protein